MKPVDWYALIPLSALGAWALNLLLNTPFEIRRNDAFVRRRDADLAKHLEDDDRQLGIELRRVTNAMASQGQLHSGALLRARQGARDHVLSRWEDQLRDATRDLENIELSERWWHGVWRRLSNRPLPHLETPESDRCGSTLARWRVPEVAAEMSEPEPGIHPNSVKPLGVESSTYSATGPFRP